MKNISYSSSIQRFKRLWITSTYYRIVRNFGSKNLRQNSDFETFVKKTLANPRLACIFSARQL